MDSLGHYKVLDRIGAGTLGDVYRARDTRLGRTVALKLPGPALQADRARLDELSADARAASVLSHPNIAALYEIGDDAGRLFLAFEFVPGEPLGRVIAGRPINVRRAVDLATQIADALADAHALGMAHGGLTADTVMVTPKGNAKILDFGFAKWTSRQAPADPGPRADIRALGVLIFDMLTGRLPGPGERVGPSVPPELDDVVARALDAGYDAAATCAAELRSVAARLDARAAASEPPRVVQIRRERLSRAWIIVAVVLVLAALVIVWRW